MIEKVDLAHVVLETDSPYLSPEPFRGKTNGPENIPLIAEKIAQIKEVSVEHVGSITTNNALALFDLTM